MVVRRIGVKARVHTTSMAMAQKPVIKRTARKKMESEFERGFKDEDGSDTVTIFLGKTVL